MDFSVETRNVIPAKVGKYEILGVIGRGGMGVVYSARDPVIDRIVAIKTIRIAEEGCDDDQIGRLRMEARSAGKLQHPNIVTVYDFGEEGDLSYIVMEYVQGINLSRVVLKRRAVPLADKLNVLTQVARGLAYAHECGVVHRDMKPSNVCVTARGVAKILDFGLARFDDTRLTKSGYLSGTIAYMSPERFSGETGPQDDIFALGAVAYEFLTYRRAFTGETTPEIISKILGGPMPPSIAEQTGYPRELDLIILRAIDRDPVQRFASAADFELAVQEFIRSDEYQEFIADETLSPQFQQPVDWTDDNISLSTNPYSSARSLGSVPMGEAPTLQIASDSAPTSHTQVDVPGGEPTLFTTKANEVRPRGAPLQTQPAVQTGAQDLQPTEVMPQRQPGRNLALIVVGAAALIAVAAGVWVTQRKPAQAVIVTPPVTETHAVAPTQTVAVTDTASQQSEVQLATAKTLADLVAQRKLTAEEKTKLADANRSLEQARMLVAERNYAGGVALAKQATDTLRELLASEPARAEAPPPKKTPVPRPAPVKTATAAPAPPPTVVAAPVPVATTQPPAVVTAPVTPPKPTRADLEREINAFMREIAVAYQEKDVAFFRQHSLRFTEQLGNAIRNSPSTRVDITVQSIKFIDDTDANVVARRTDRFAEANMPPGVQTLVFELRRTADGWKIVTFSRG